MDPQTEAALGTTPLLLIAVGSIALLLILIIRFHLHAFLALIVVSFLTAFAARVPVDEILDVLTSAFSDTLGSVALLVGLGAMLGRLLERSGGAQALSDALIARFGEDRAPLALGLASLAFGFPIFFDAGLVVMLPIIFSVARRVGGGLLVYALPVTIAFSVMHAFVAPHPGPVAAAELVGAEIGIVTLVGLAVALPTWAVVGWGAGTAMGRRVIRDIPDFLGRKDPDEDDLNIDPPSAGTVLWLLILPIAIIFVNTGLDTLRAAGFVDGKAGWYTLARTIGATPVALLIAVLVAIYVLGVRRGIPLARIEPLLNGALGPICAIILITGAGGMFGGALAASGIGSAISGVFEGIGLPVIVSGFLLASVLRIAQGSATVALITSAGLIEPALTEAGVEGIARAAVVAALAAGSVGYSHVNDSGFWLVSRFFELDVKTTLKTWTVLETLVALVAFAIACGVYALAI
ncbi:Inner membrane permease YgbN [Rhodobacteraceae bacterium THAF1]|uniref:GntP family permease n=1 Tax=Palleronia sp. THAF1 TaxID=2587842 RepID=UPI000F41E49A|nr:GntP family permease [Palleronia sp. THAF1]QFU08581.1 Inner membrane permease YgbN [Palleronia sp. THAF1]VDC30659.1 Inner membrane permease YgbN [Rhodobacteraceae bacterium THAF1]